MRQFTIASALLLAACNSGPEDRFVEADTSSEAFPDQPAVEPTGRFAPRNECIEDPKAKPFFLALGKAVRDRDVEGLLKLTSRDVKLDFGGGGGLTTFRERLAAEDGQLWKELDDILLLGCGRDESGNMVMPWFFTQDLGIDDPFSAMLVLGPEIAVRDMPSTEGKPVEIVAWDMVETLDGYDPGAKFRNVRTRAGNEGYIPAEELRSPVDYRLAAAPAGDGWQIVLFVAGD